MIGLIRLGGEGPEQEGFPVRLWRIEIPSHSLSPGKDIGTLSTLMLSVRASGTKGTTTG